ncbi:JAB domain-containing protein [Candidatus Kapabacteria bacterium]|nr:JAB domain-containing protein [Candidatus Kapabacteria bacterium]
MNSLNKNNDGHRKRLKNKVFDSLKINKPFYGLNDYEILEYLLFFFLPRIDTKPIAKKLISKYKTLSECLDANPIELMKIEGVKENTAYGIVSFRELINLYSIENILGKSFNLVDIKKFYKIIFKNKLVENLHIITLNQKDKIISSEFIGSGTNDKLLFDLSKIVKKAVSDNASSIIIAHNHPGEDCKPSKEDIINTDELKFTLAKIEIKLLDHYIISGSDIFSFLENKLL